ncbi:MAG: PRC-barrel domain-containing protein [Candidatus Thermoplasmatota archaeon]|nr:PRC-barrel domain-containing protein [Candidatus Thermoplasmatota archaeon]
MMLGSELEGYQVFDSLGEKVGKVKDAVVDATREEWLVKEIVFSWGVMKGDGVFSFEDIENLNESEERIELKERAELRDFDKEKFSRRYLSMDAVGNRDVFGSDEEEIGKIYDYVLTTKLTPWQVTKLLIKPYGTRLKGRRIRLDVENVSQIKDVITVKQSIEELDKTASED